MKIINVLLVAILAILSVAAGIAKVMQAPQEMEFLQGLGLSSTLIVVFGMAQIAAGLLLAPLKTRTFGAVLAAAALAVSTVLIFVSGNVAFGFVSTLPIVVAGAVIYQSSVGK